jgi:hypothetical protein
MRCLIVIALLMIGCLGSEEDYEQWNDGDNVYHQVDCDEEDCEVREVDEEQPESFELGIAPCLGVIPSNG